MSYRDILVQADNSESSSRRSTAAAGLARRFGAHLTGVFLRTSFPSQVFTSGLYGGMPWALVRPRDLQGDIARIGHRPGQDHQQPELAGI